MLPKVEKHVLSAAVEKFKRPPSQYLPTGHAGTHAVMQVSVSHSGPIGHKHTLDDVMELINHLEASGFVHPFDWISWSKSLPQGWQTNAALIDSADVDTIRGLVTAHLRIDRHSDGHLDALFKNGYMDRLFDRLQTLVDQLD